MLTTDRIPSYEMHETEPRIVETFTVLDLDRTLLASDTLVELMYNELVRAGIPADKATSDLSFIYDQTGTSFSLFEHMAQEFGEEAVNIVKEAMLTQAKQGLLTHDDVLCEGAKELVDYLINSDIPHAVLTFGEQNFQDFKIMLTRAILNKTEEELPALVTSIHRKAEWIADAWDTDGERFVVPMELTGGVPVEAEGIVVIDDKSSNLTSNNSRIKGILVDNSNNRPSESLSTAHLAEYVEALPLTRIAELQALNSAK